MTMKGKIYIVYGFDTKISEAECVARLLERYRRFVEQSENESR